MKSLHARKEHLSESDYQLKILNGKANETQAFQSFEDKLKDYLLFPLKPLDIEILQINLGYMCNQTCSHCHVDAGPDRKEIMSRETMDLCLKIIATNKIGTIDLTGGAPEMNPDFRWFVSRLRQMDINILVRSNLTIIVSNPAYHDLPSFYKSNKVEVISSLPYFSKRKTDHQRGEGVFNQSVMALTMLNEVGYGLPGSGLKLNLVYNPSGAFLPADQKELETQFKKHLKKDFNIQFNNLFTITNLPISRFLKYLLDSGNYEDYMEKLINAFNPVAATQVMCRNTISVGWDGILYDCDFNQMLNLPVNADSKHIKFFDKKLLKDRNIVLNQHCYGCTAGAGSSCGGALVE